MYMDDLRVFAKKEVELETFIRTIRIYSHDTALEFSSEKSDMLLMKSWKRESANRIE